MSYCISRFFSKRLPTHEVNVGGVALGGQNPIRIQSMTNTSTLDVAATVRQVLQLAEAGCELVRVTAQNVEAAKALESIHKQVRAAKCNVPLVADIHFLPQAAMEAIKHVEKVRVNPGNYADKKKFATREYSDTEYAEEIERLHASFSPLVLRAKELGRALRIGTNHGSLSDRIMNRYGDSPLGMVESALEFIRICEAHNFYDIVLSMKASNPKVMIEAYRLAAQKMAEGDRIYPLHLGVTEAGDGEDGRIKSAIGIGSLLLDGLGDTIRVSLTEDPVYEVPVAKEIIKRAEHLWERKKPQQLPFEKDSIDPFSYTRRQTETITLGNDLQLGSEQVPRIVVPAPPEILDIPAFIQSITQLHAKNKEQRIEGLLFKVSSSKEFPKISQIA
ncbi:MAG: 4-hydroxy-3-methylbut-2-en-1-yl diphosphate synthase, partial [Verrucomicrobia bacterium 21-51-4]